MLIFSSILFVVHSLNPLSQKVHSSIKNKKLIVSPSVAKANQMHLYRDLSSVVSGGAEWLHFSVQDGNFAPKISFGMNIIKATRQLFPDTTLDVKLSIVEPEKLITSFASAGADIISIHPESTKQLGAAIDKIKQEGCSPGIVLNPGTPVSFLECLAQEIDVIVIMLVNPGWGGKKYEKIAIDKINKIKKIYEDADLIVPHIEIDGGVSLKNAPAFAAAGANVFVIGKDIFSSNKSPSSVIEDFFHLLIRNTFYKPTN